MMIFLGFILGFVFALILGRIGSHHLARKGVYASAIYDKEKDVWTVRGVHRWQDRKSTQARKRRRRQIYVLKPTPLMRGFLLSAVWYNHSSENRRCKP